MKGLLIDDDVVFAGVLERALQRRGMHTRIAHDAQSALELAREQRPDFVLLDLKLGRDSGLSLIAPLRALVPDARIVVLTGYASIATAVEAIKRGADDYLPKPITAAALLRVLREDVGADEPVELEAMLPLSRVEWEHIQQALAESGGNVSAAARLLGMHRRSLQRKLAKRPEPERRPEREAIV